MNTKVYAGRLKNREELKNSSSGGAFTALSNIFLRSGGAVVASIYNYSDNTLNFSIILDQSSRNAARGSKYFQSNMQDVFHDSETWLQEHSDKKLMFCGTGCQADAFIQYMKCRGLEDRIFTVDIICYGVVSPQLWRDYIESKVGDNPVQISNLTFKDKRNGWKKPTAIVTINGQEYYIEDYVRVFYSDNALRPSCYQCPYAKTERLTDITIGDYWGIDSVMPEFYDPMGNSLFLIHTQKGMDLFESVQDQIEYKESTIENCMQSHLKHPTEKPTRRNEFWITYHQKGIKKILERYGQVSFMKKANSKIKHIFNHTHSDT